MALSDRQVWVIKNQDGYYVNPDFQVLFTGHTSGFITYSNKETMEEDLEMLGEGYYSEYININDIPKGERIFKN